MNLTFRGYLSLTLMAVGILALPLGALAGIVHLISLTQGVAIIHCGICVAVLGLYIGLIGEE